MEKTKLTFSEKVINTAQIFGSRGAAFIYAALGVITQIFHNYYVSEYLSSFEGFVKILQAGLMAAFLSFALLYFVTINDGKKKHVNVMMWIFFFLEFIVNSWYWINKLVVLSDIPNWYGLVIAIPIAFMIPWTIKAYGSEVRAFESINSVHKDDVKKLTDEIIDLTDKITNIKSELTNEINDLSNEVTDDLKQYKLNNTKEISIINEKISNDNTPNKLNDIHETIKNDLNDIRVDVDNKIKSIELNVNDKLSKGDEFKLSIKSGDEWKNGASIRLD